MSKIMNQLFLGSDLEYAQELLGEDPGYQKFLDKVEKESDDIRRSEKAVPEAEDTLATRKGKQ